MNKNLDFSNASIVGSLLMAGVGFAAFAISSWYLKLDWLTVFTITTSVTLTFGIVYNFVAQRCGAKKIHWLDFAFSFLPWDF